MDAIAGVALQQSRINIHYVGLDLVMNNFNRQVQTTTPIYIANARTSPPAHCTQIG
jgi:hypothetical protein